jgi:excinuclease ABC subunit B
MYAEPMPGEGSMAADPVVAYLSKDKLEKLLVETQKAMEKSAKELNFMEAARLRDEWQAQKKRLAELTRGPGK